MKALLLIIAIIAIVALAFYFLDEDIVTRDDAGREEVSELCQAYREAKEAGEDYVLGYNDRIRLVREGCL